MAVGGPVNVMKNSGQSAIFYSDATDSTGGASEDGSG